MTKAIQTPANEIDIAELENASADICVTDTFLEAADNFIDSIREWVMPDGTEPNSALFQDALNAQTMIAEAKIRLAEATSRISLTVKAEFARRKAEARY